MLGRKDYTREELDNGRAAIDGQVAAYKSLVKSIPNGTPAVGEFEWRFFNNMTLVLDRLYVHRLRVVTGKDGNPLNEVELMSDSLMSNDGVLRGNNVIKFVADESVLELDIGDRIRLSASQFQRLATAFFAELESRFVQR